MHTGTKNLTGMLLCSLPHKSSKYVYFSLVHHSFINSALTENLCILYCAEWSKEMAPIL